MLTLYQSNRLSVLKSLLFEILQLHKSPNPLASETILVPDVAMENWLTIALATEFKIVAGINFNRPDKFLWKLQQQEQPNFNKNNFLDKSSLVWKIISIINDYLNDNNFTTVKQYINYGNNIELRKYQLAQSIANLFIDYIKYRPDLLINWQNYGSKAITSPENMWQPILWRSLVQKIDYTNKDLLINLLQPESLVNSISTNAIPSNIFLFAINSLPKSILQSFYVLAKKTNIHLFSHNPCSYYWGDSAPKKKKASSANIDSVSHVLLDTMGKLGKDYFNSLHEMEVNSIDAFADDYQPTILGNIQKDIYKLQDNRKNSCKYKFLAEDDSLLFHSCHSPLRELQILHDRLLNWFSKDNKLTPKDILIVAPDINLYTPWIKAVFAQDKHTDTTYIPYAVCNATTKHLNNYTTTVLKLLMLDKSRCTGEEILEILAVTAVRQKFTINYEDLTIIRNWVNKLNICWGLNAKHRHNFLANSNEFNTWEFGIQRLLLGYAIPETDGIYQDILPSEFANGKTAELVGKLVDFLATINNIATSCPKQATITNWINWFNNSITNIYLINNDNDVEFNIELETILHKLADNIISSNYSKTIDKQILTSYLTDKLQNDTKKSYIPNGKLTFANISSVSSGISFKIVCFLGMNSTDFPSYDTPVDFDLKAKNPRSGDELKKDQDKYNFLQLFVSAEQKVHISFIGQSINDNSIKMPSIIIEEIIEYFNQSFELTNNQTSKQHPLIFKHALQPFSSKNFQDIATNYFSYRTNWQVTTNKQQLTDNNIPSLEAPSNSIELAALISLFKNPVKYFYNRCLGIYFEEPEAILPDSEPFNIDSLESYKLKQEIIEILYNKQQISDSNNLYKAAGKLPHYLFADCVINDVINKLDKILPWLREINVNLNTNISVNINLANQVNITAEITKFTKGNLVFIQPTDNVKGKHIIEAWLSHLCCCTQQPTTTHILYLDKKLLLKPVEPAQALTYLIELTTVFQQALVAPIPWLPCIAYKLITEVKKNEKNGNAIATESFYQKKLADYITDTYNDPDIYVARVFPDLANHHEQFYSLTKDIFSPVLEYLEDTTKGKV